MELDIACTVRRTWPAARLWLTYALGALGGALFALAARFHIASRGPALVWAAMAVTAALLLYRLERRKLGVHFCAVLTALTALYALFWLVEVHTKYEAYENWFALFITARHGHCVLLLALVTIVLVSWRLGRSSDKGAPEAWLEVPARAASLVVAAPLMLFAMRPVAKAETFTVRRATTHVAFILFPYALGLGFTLPFLLGPRHTSLGAVAFAFSVSAWLACSIIHLLTPWPEEPRRFLPCALSPERKMGALGTSLFMAVPLAALAKLFWPAVLYVARGDVFVHQFSLDDVGALDQGTLQKALFLSAYLGVPTLLFLVTARWLSDRRTRVRYGLFMILALATAVHPLSLLTIGFYELCQYVHAMGLTPKRVIGLAYGGIGFALSIASLAWILRPTAMKTHPSANVQGE